VLNLLSGENVFDPKGRQKEIGWALAQIHGPTFSAVEQHFYSQWLLHGGTTSVAERQKRMWDLVERANQEGFGPQWTTPLGIAEVEVLMGLANEGGDEELRDRLSRIRCFEHVVGPSRRLFSHLQNSNGREVDPIVEGLREVWGGGLKHVDPEAFALHLEPVVELHGSEGEQRFIRLAQALRDGDYPVVLDLLLAQNREVMDRRGGGPWVVFDKGRIKVRYRGESDELPEATDLPTLWTNVYFLDALKSIGAELYGYRAGGAEDG